MLSNETTIQAQIKLQNYFTKNNCYIDEVHLNTNYDNYTNGDVSYSLIKNNKLIKLNIDYKQQKRDRDFIQIELIQVSNSNKYDSWLYNKNIHLVLYTFKNNASYLIPKHYLLLLAKYYNTDEYWNKSTVYNTAWEYELRKYNNERNWINNKLTNIPVEQFNYSAFVNGCFSTNRTHSGFCLNIPIDEMKKFLI